jgi:hypothetical protein
MRTVDGEGKVKQKMAHKIDFITKPSKASKLTTTKA